jgi:hypothetical protein
MDDADDDRIDEPWRPSGGVGLPDVGVPEPWPAGV